MDFGYEPALDADAEELTDRIVEGMCACLLRVALRPAFVEALALEARPAIQALLFAIDTERADDPNSLEHHETTAMVALLGRASAFDGSTLTAASAIVPAMLASLRSEGFAVPESLDRALELVFLEGFVRGREERLRSEFGARALESIRLTGIASRVGLLVVRGDHEPELLALHLERVARQAFGLGLVACVVDAANFESTDGVVAAIVAMVELLRSVGIEVVVVGAALERAVSDDVHVRASTEEAVMCAFESAGLSPSRARGLPGALLGLFGVSGFGRAAR